MNLKTIASRELHDAFMRYAAQCPDVPHAEAVETWIDHLRHTATALEGVKDMIVDAEAHLRGQKVG
jgi:hypothetical protein